jgi:tRNA(Ile)-lysidine synthase
MARSGWGCRAGNLLDLAGRTISRDAMVAAGDTVIIGVSGGADSVALLHILVTLALSLGVTLRVLHVDHGLRAESAWDADFVRRVGTRLGVPVEVTRVTVDGGSVEAAARAARHAALEAAADRAGAARIALGHTEDDQAETVLMRVLEGSGVRGLAGIPAVRGRIIRPLINARRTDVVAHLEEVGLPWLEDPSNRDLRFLRNRVRHQILPVVADACEGDVVTSLTRVGRLARATIDTVDRLAEAELDRLGTVEADAITLSRAAIAALPAPVAAELLREAASRVGGRASLRAWGHRGLARVLAAPAPRRPFRLGGVIVEVSGDRVRVGARATVPLEAYALDVPGRVEVPEIGRALEARLVPAAGYVVPRDAAGVAFDAAALPRRLMIRARRRGDRFRPFGAGERRLKTFLIDAKVPRWERARLPLVDAGGEIIWVVGVRRAAVAPVTPATRDVMELRVRPL